MFPKRFQKDLDILYKGINSGIEPTKTTGVLSVFGPRAFPVLVGKSSDANGSRQVVGAAGRLGEGRVVAFANDSFINPDNPSTNTLLNNSIAWTLDGNNKANSAVRIVSCGKFSSLEAWKPLKPFEVKILKPEDVREGAEQFDVVILGALENSSSDFVEFLTAWVRRGGGLITYFNSIDDHKDVTPSQTIGLEAGIAATSAHNVTTLDGASGFQRPDLAQLKDTHAGDAWKILLAEIQGEAILASDLKNQLSSIIETAKAALPPSHPLLKAVEAKNVVNYHVEDLKILLLGLETSGIKKGGSIGVMTVFGPDAFPIVIGKYSEDDTIGVAGAGARYGNGRLTGFGHDSQTNPTDPCLNKYLTNCITWVGKGKQNLRVSILSATSDLDSWISENKSKFRFEEYDNSDSLIENLHTTDVILFCDISELKAEQVPKVKEFIKQGGGLVTSATAWTTNDIDRFIGNSLAFDSGFAWTSSLEIVPLSGSDSYTVDPNKLVDVHAGEAWDLVNADISDEIKLSAERLKQLSTLVSFAIDVMKPAGYFSEVLKIDLRDCADVIPSESHEISNPSQKLLLRFGVKCIYNFQEPKSGRQKRELGDKCVCHPATRFFPGLPTGTERTINQSVTVNLHHSAWYSTGLYAPPGEEIVVKFDSPVTEKLSIQIGSHSDDISKLENWKRCPLLTLKKAVPENETEIRISNTFGGLIYVVVDSDLDSQITRTVTITGAIPALRFILGETTLEAWNAAKSKTRTPWGELETSKLILTLPVDRLEKLEDPIELLEHWNQVMDALADLAGISKDRPRPERIVADVEISAGYMHSGYPIMMLTDESVDAVSLRLLKTDQAWGHYHEIGHNHQQDSWTFDHTTEVTNNMFVLYVFEKVCGLSALQARPDTFESNIIKSKLEEYSAQNPNYSIWDDEPFTGLLFYYQLQQKYGWSVYKSVIRSYIDENLDPTSQEEKVDTWLIQFSIKSGFNLVPMFIAWGLPVSESAISKVSHLPETDQDLFSLTRE